LYPALSSVIIQFLRTADVECSSRLGIGESEKNFWKKRACYEIITIFLEYEAAQSRKLLFLFYSYCLLSCFTSLFFCFDLSFLSPKLKLNSVALDREWTMLTERPPLFGEVEPTFVDRVCCVVSSTDSHGR
jgi:hypothetical protein